jgi:hypothetical protein
MTYPQLLTNILLYFVLPVWVLAGFADWLCHRKTRICETSGAKESLFHLLLLTEAGIPVLAGLFLEINALIIAVMIAAFITHEATAYWDVKYAVTRREVPPIEQHVHSFLELMPLTAIILVVALHWDQFAALVTPGSEGRYTLEWKRNPLPAGYLVAFLGLTFVLNVIPFAEEFWRCWKRNGGLLVQQR